MAKRRKLNTKFIVAAAIPVVLVGGAYLGRAPLGRAFPRLKWMVRGTPSDHAGKARALFAEGKYTEAAEEFKRAIQLNGAGTAELYTDLGDCYSHLVFQDSEALRVTKTCLDQAISIDPNYLPALEKELDLFEDDAEINHGTNNSEQWQNVDAAAGRVLAADPKNRKALIAQNRATLQRWLSGVEVSPQRIDEAVASLQTLAEQTPFDANAMFYAMQSKIARGIGRVKQNDRQGADALFQEAMKSIDDMLAAHPDDAATHYRASQALLSVGLAERAPGQPAKYQDRIRAELDKADSLVKADDPMYVEIKRYYAQQLPMLGDMKGGIKSYHALLEQRPGDMATRLQLAELLVRDPATRVEGIDLLENAPQPDLKQVYGVRALLERRYQLMAGFDVINAKLDAMSETNTADQQAQLKDLSDRLAKLTATPGVADSPLSLQTRGRIELAKGDNIQALQTLQRARSLMPVTAINTPADFEQYFKLSYLLANACIATDQTAEAKQLLAELIRVNDKFVPGRIKLVQLLLKEGNKADAQPQLDALERLAPNVTLVTRLRILSLDPTKDKDRLAQLYAKLPETTSQEMQEKASVSKAAGQSADAARLFEKIIAADPSDLRTTIMLARLYVELGDKPKAMALMDNAVAKNPNVTDLQIVRSEVSGADISDLRREVVEKTQDPFLRELGFYDLAIRDGNDAEASQHLQAAAKLKPEDGRVLSLQFSVALKNREWDKASQYVEKLAAMNQDLAGGLLFRVRLALAKGNRSEAYDQAQQLTQKLPAIAQSWVVLGQVQLAMDKPADAIVNFQSALQKQSNNLDAIRGLIAANYQLNQPAESLHYIQLGRQMFPKYAQLREMELQHELRYGDPEKVVAPRQEMLKEAIAAKDPGEARAWLALGSTLVAVAQNKDTPAAARPYLLQASDTFKQASAKFPDEIAFVKAYADASLRLKNVADGEKAIQDFRARPAWQGKPDPTILLADYYSRAAKPAEQEAVLRDYLKSNPQSIPVEIQLAAMLSGQNKVDDALKVLQANPDDPLIRRQRIEIEITGNRMADAERELQGALSGNPNPSPILLDRQALLYIKTGRPTEALQVLNKVLAQDPNDPEALFFRGSIYVSFHKNLDQAIKDLEAVRDGSFNQLQARLMLSDARRYAGDSEGSIRELEDAVRAFPLEKSARLRLIDAYSRTKPPRWSLAERAVREAKNQPQLSNDPDILNAEALMWIDRKDPEKARSIVMPIVQQASGASLDVLRTYYRATLAAKMYKELLSQSDAMAKSGKAPWWLFELRGRAQKALGDSTAALNEFSAGFDAASATKDDASLMSIVTTMADEIGITPVKTRIFDAADKGDNHLRMVMSYLLLKENDVPGAISWVERVMADPTVSADQLAQSRGTAATLYLRLEPPAIDKAVDVYKKMLDRDPNDIASLNNLACAMILPNSKFQPSEALKYSQRAFDQIQSGAPDSPVMPYIYDTQGWVLVLSNRVQEGINLLQQAIERQPIPEACYHLGEAYMKLPVPQTAAAQESLNQALKLLEAATLDDKPLDADLKSKIEKSLQQTRQTADAQPG